MTPRSKWNAQQIRLARQVALKPLLEQMGYSMQALKNDNWKVYGLSVDLIVKETYWICPDTGAGGNAIDLLVQVMGMSFSQAMDKVEAFKQP
jgi:hypothetical protein